MSSEITMGGPSPSETTPDESERRFVPMRVGDAWVYVEQVGEPPDIAEESSEIYMAAGIPSPEDVFENASGVVKECVRIVGDRLGDLRRSGKAVMPEELSVEFSLSFEGSGKASLIPVLVTAETKTTTGLKVKAVWKATDKQESG